MTEQVRLHVGYVGITREGKRVEIKSSNVTGTYPWLATSLDTYSSSGHYYHGHHISPADIVGPWVAPVDYNDGKWHRWAGGECPVHPSSVVHATYIELGCIHDIESVTGGFIWDSVHAPIIAFRVTKVHVEPPKVPREFWVRFGTAYNMPIESDAIHVREVLTDD
jgi:hypothetical protein